MQRTRVNLSHITDEQRSQAAEFVARKLWSRYEPGLNVDYQAIAQGLLTSTDEAVKALESATKEKRWNCCVVLRNSPLTYSEVTLREYDHPLLIMTRRIQVRFSGFGNMPAAITLCLALLMGFKVEEEK